MPAWLVALWNTYKGKILSMIGSYLLKVFYRILEGYLKKDKPQASGTNQPQLFP